MKTHKFKGIALLCVVLWLIRPISSQAAQPGESNALLLMTYIGAVRSQVVEALAACSSPECAAFRALDRAVQQETVAEVGVDFVFAAEVWLFDTDAAESRVGPAASVSRQRTRVFVSRPVPSWSGDILLIASAVAPQRVSMLRLSGVGTQAPRIRVLYDSLRRSDLIGRQVTPLGGVNRVEVTAPGHLRLYETAPLGSRGEIDPRRCILTFEPDGIALKLGD